MQGGGERDGAEGCLDATAGVAGFQSLDPLFPEVGGDLVGGEDGGSIGYAMLATSCSCLAFQNNDENELGASTSANCRSSFRASATPLA